MHFTIDRSKWICGSPAAVGLNFNNPLSPIKNFHGKGFTELLNAEGFMCCLGQISLQLGCSKNEIQCQINPSSVAALRSTILMGNYSLSKLSQGAIAINDCQKTSLEEKEESLIELFKEDGHTIEFIGEYYEFCN